MELLTQQGLCLPGSMRTCIVMQQNISSRELPSSAEDLIGLKKTNNTSHLTVCGILNHHNHGHSYLCTYHVTRPDVQLHETTIQHHTEHYKPMIGCNKTGARTVCTNFLYFLDGLRTYILTLTNHENKQMKIETYEYRNVMLYQNEILFENDSHLHTCSTQNISIFY